ncbi:MAG: hypothetical protein ABIK62_00745 [candidate division WOR-3 bacterium]
MSCAQTVASCREVGFEGQVSVMASGENEVDTTSLENNISLGKGTKMRLASVSLVICLAGLLLVCVPILPDQEFEPSGTQFSISAPISVTRITGATSQFDPTALYAVVLTARSTSSGAESDVLPAGLHFRSRLSRYQHLILLHDYRITAYPGGSAIVIGVYCCNSRRTPPDDSSDYELGPLTDNAELRQVVAITKHKHLDVSNISYVQSVVNRITDGAGLSQPALDSLNALPELGELDHCSGISLVSPEMANPTQDFKSVGVGENIDGALGVPHYARGQVYHRGVGRIRAS